MRILLVNGPNLGRLGQRNPEIYGTTTLAEVVERAAKHAAERGSTLEAYQSNHEGALIDRLEQLDYGCVWINTHIPLVGEMPHGGFKHSGYGKDLSMYGLEDYTRIKHVMSYIGE